MDLLVVATELYPFVVRSPLAARVSALAKSLRLLGHSVTLVLPRSPEFEENGILAARRLTPLSLAEGRQALLFQAELPSGARLALVDVPGRTVEGLDGAFAEAVTALALERAEHERPFDVIHGFGNDGEILHRRIREELGRDQISVHTPLDVGTVAASATATIYLSPAQASQAEGVDGFDPVRALLGGLDASFENPSTDSSLVARYDAEQPANKGRSKTAFSKELGLEIEPRKPLFVIDAGTSAAGLEVALEALVELTRQDAHVVVSTHRPLTPVEEAPLAVLSTMAAVVTLADDPSRRRAMAAADFFVSLDDTAIDAVPVLRAARYGAVPVVRNRGIARDLVVDVDAELATGSGLVFDVLSARGLVTAVGRAVAAYRSPEFPRLVRRIMRQDFGWERATRRHLHVYRTLADASLVK